MKISLRWLSEHLSLSYDHIAWDKTISLFNEKVAEIDAVYPLTLNKNCWLMAQATALMPDAVTCFIPESQESITLSYRNNIKLSSWYLVIKDVNNSYRWALLADAHSDKIGFIPAVTYSADSAKKEWKDTIDWDDCVITISNTSLTQRPDLWGHRGIAREVALLLDCDLVKESHFLSVPDSVHQNAQSSVTLKKTASACTALAALYMPVKWSPSIPATAFRLMRVGARPIDALIDGTNYVMFDWGYPMHAFDAAQVKDHVLTARFACDKEQLTLLDGTTVTLSSHDIVIADNTQPLSLAGIMGGNSSGVTEHTQDLIVEAGCFDPTIIRQSSLCHKKRTESSTRFEKGMDAYQVPIALQRYAHILANHDLIDSKNFAYSVIVIQEQQDLSVITITHSFICAKLGLLELSPEKIIYILSKLGCLVNYDINNSSIYKITVPSYRKKDLRIAEDIVEEIGRSIGYTCIPENFPLFKRTQFSSPQPQKIRTIKSFLASALSMHELQSYAFFNENFIRKINYEPLSFCEIISPVSENWRRLNTVLTPHLFEAIESNCHSKNSLRFFEWGRVWKQDNGDLQENFQLAGILWDKSSVIDFYTGKAALESFFNHLRLPVSWHTPPLPSRDPWYNTHESAQLRVDDKIFGYAGTITHDYTLPFAAGYGFTFTIDGNLLLSSSTEPYRYHAPSKYQAVNRDISIIIGQEHTADSLATVIMGTHSSITHVELTDFFKREDWDNKKGLTFRLTILNTEKTMTKADIDTICDAAYENLRMQGALIR